MKGTVIKRGKKWAVVLDLGVDANGKRIRKWHSGFRTKREAEDKRIELLHSLNVGGYVAPAKMSVADYMTKKWIPATATRVRASTLHSYERNVRLHVLPHLGHVQLRSVDGAALDGLYATLGANLSPRTIRYIHTIIHRALKDAVKWKLLAVNPADSATPPSAAAHPSPEMQTWRAVDLNTFLEKSKEEDDRFYAAWYLLATTGMRRGEVLGLRWQDVGLDTGVISVRQTLVRYGNTVKFERPKTAKGRRSVSLDRGTLAVLKAHKTAQLEIRLQLRRFYEDNDLVFPKVSGEPYHPERFSREFDRRVQRYGLPRVRLHDLRHTWATLALQAGVHPKVVSERLGHSNISITLDTYSHVVPEMATDAAETVAGLIRGNA